MNQSLGMSCKNLYSNAAKLFFVFLLSLSTFTAAQSPIAASTVPTLVNFSGALTDLNGKAMPGIHGVTFYLYKDSAGGAPLWLETQNVQADSRGRYTVQLGASSSQGLPKDLFASGEARWLGVQPEGQTEQPRVLLLSVPYALKAADAETIGGLPPSAFVLAAPPNTISAAAPGAQNSTTPTAASVPPPASSNVTTTGGTANAIPLFTTSTNIQNSILSQTGTAAINVLGKLNFPATGVATAAKGFPSRPQDFVASVFNSGTSTAVPQTFQLQAEPAGNNTATASGTLNLLYGSGTAAPAETGLKISNKGILTFAAGQTFPGTGKVTSVGLSAPATDFTVSGSPVTTTGTLGLAWNVAPASANTANAIVKRDSTGGFSAGIISVSEINSIGTIAVATPDQYAIAGETSNDGGVGVLGEALVGSNYQSFGVEGVSVSSTPGSSAVLGADENDSGPAGGFTIGVQGISYNTTGMGLAGFTSRGVSGTFGTVAGTLAAGVWADNSQGSSGIGIVGTTDNATGAYFVNNSPSYFSLEAVNLASTGPVFMARNNSTGGYCQVDSKGNLTCSGTKNAVVPIDGGKRKVALSAIESPVNWFEDAGSGHLVNGVAIVALDPDFIQTVNTDLDYKVFPVPNGDCKGLYVTSKTATSFEVRELGGGTSSVTFDYRIMALRKNYENVRFADHTNDPEPRNMREQLKNIKQQPARTAQVRTHP